MKVRKPLKEVRILDHACPAPPSDCILWERSVSVRGYGQIRRNGRTEKAHHVVLEQELGIKVPPGMVVMHTCDVPSCVNPRHLRIASQRENIADRVAKGRNGGTEKISADTVRLIRSHAGGPRGWIAALARELGCSAGQVSNIARGRGRTSVR